MRISDWSSDVCSSDLFVRKGETGALVVYANSFTATETDEDGEESEREIPYLKGYTVFNCEQIEGLPAHYYARAEEPASPVARLEQADAFFAATRADIRHRSEEHTSELQSLMRISYAVFCLKKKKIKQENTTK